MFSLSVIALILFTSKSTFADNEIPDFIKVCHRKDPKVDECIVNTINELRPRLIAGIPELGVPPIDPLNIDNLALNLGNGNNRVSTNLTNIQFSGSGDFEILSFESRVYKKKDIFRYKVRIPKISVVGEYDVNTRLLFLVIKGKGPISINVTDYVSECVLTGNKQKSDGITHIIFEPMQCIINVGKIAVRLDNLFNGDRVLGKATNDVLNENADVFLNDIRESLLETTGRRLTNLANRITSKFDYNELFPV